VKHFIETLRALGPLGVLILAILDCAGVPVVGGVDALLIFVAVTAPQSAYPSAAMAVLGSVIGSLFLFIIARKGGEAYLDRYTASPQGARLKRWFLEYGLLTIFVPAGMPIVPMPLKVFILSAGALGVSPVVFIIVLLVARVIRYYTIAYLALQLGSQTLPYLRHHIWQLVGIAFGVFLTLYLLIRFADKRRKLGKLVTDSE
jgi:membrane protein YqaA with SNARE-associated domain